MTAPAAIALAIPVLTPDVWRELRVVAGPEGIVATRPSADQVPGRLDLPPLRDARISPAWKVPYGMGRR